MSVTVVKQSREEKMAMYMELKKKELVEMLINCNEILDKQFDNTYTSNRWHTTTNLPISTN